MGRVGYPGVACSTTFDYRPGGLGIVRVCAYVDGKLDTVAHRTVSQMEALFQRAAAYNEENQS